MQSMLSTAVFQTSHYAGAGWTIVAAGLECSFKYLQNAAISSSLLTEPQSGQIAGRDAFTSDQRTTARTQIVSDSAAREMADTNPSTIIRRVMVMVMEAGAARFSLLLA
jgi:hypothetical protein